MRTNEKCKIIVSHDVDHLYSSDHWFRDLIYPKMWVRTTLALIAKQISIKEWRLRNSSCFRRNRHNLEAQMQFDKDLGIKSTFFFGMNQGLGMSYKPHEAKSMIETVHKNGFPVGVHGVEYQDIEGMKKEYLSFKKTMGFEPCGIRMHYVRFNKDTFKYLDEVGYAFDATEFDKSAGGTRKNPYRVGNMWEFPLSIMDGYLPQRFLEARKQTMEILKECNQRGLKYISVLFHDYQFCDDYKDMYDWYIWLMSFFTKSDEYEFISYDEAIVELNSEDLRLA